MEPEIIALARRMYEAAERRAYADEGRRPRVLSWEMIRVGERRQWLEAAQVARPDLADVRVEPGHWAAGILPTTQPSVRVGEEPGGWMNGRRVKL